MIGAGAQFYASFGYTTCQEGRAMGPTMGRLAQAADRGLLPAHRARQLRSGCRRRAGRPCARGNP
jgi:hypothetical protein